MLTGDKLETAACVAVSSKLVARNQRLFNFSATTKVPPPLLFEFKMSQEEAVEQLQRFKKKPDQALIIEGFVATRDFANPTPPVRRSLELCVENFPREFIEGCCAAPAVVCCRCSPTQKASIVKLINKYQKRPTCAVGDGGNDVAMIQVVPPSTRRLSVQAASVGVGIVGKEGRQASLAADFALTTFAHLNRLLRRRGGGGGTHVAVVHGRNSCASASSSLTPQTRARRHLRSL